MPVSDLDWSWATPLAQVCKTSSHLSPVHNFPHHPVEHGHRVDVFRALEAAMPGPIDTR